MGSQLLIRSYNVGCGDCIYVRIPNGSSDNFHMLIDCGSKEGASSGVMKRAIRHLEDHELPDDGAGKKRLDMIVVTHRHEDHIKGFNPTFFKNISIGHIWITAAMDKTHKQAKKARALHEVAAREMRALARSRTPLSPELRELVGLYGINNKGATDALTVTLPKQNKIKPTFVFAGQTSADHDIKIKNTKITVLAPEKNIDGFYLGKQTEMKLRSLQAGSSPSKRLARTRKYRTPGNISSSDFRNLQKRLLSNALAFAVDDSELQNNVSTVLLIEWGKRRLLFVGDAEWKGKYREGKKNGSWNVMWKQRKAALSKPVDFLKVGHHGSHNATPWNRHADETHEVNQIFNSILPRPKAGEEPTAQCIVSTKRKQYDTIPDAELLVELGKRVANTHTYLQKLKDADSGFDPDQDIANYSVMKTYSKQPSPRQVGDKGWLDQPQPVRTDLESAGRGSEKMSKAVEFVDVMLDP